MPASPLILRLSRNDHHYSREDKAREN
jgi:hypothetical protein